MYKWLGEIKSGEESERVDLFRVFILKVIGNY